MTKHAPPTRVVLTGGPGAGKTAVLEVVRQHLCDHVAVLPEAASVVFGGGFPRRDDLSARRAAQRAIFHMQVELERLATDSEGAALVLCDRGVVDGSVYWPDGTDAFWREVGMSRTEALSRYRAVIHLRTPAEGGGYDRSNPLRVESARDAHALDERLLDAWSGHPRRVVVDSAESFFDKLAAALALLRDEMPECCREHIPAPPPRDTR